MSTDVQKSTAVFPLLADPLGYVACQWDLSQDDARRAYWLKLFRDHFKGLLDLAIEDALDRGLPRELAEAQAAKAHATFTAYTNHVEAEPDAFGRLTILSFCEAREKSLRQADIPDPYRLAKTRENEAALKLLPDVLSEIDELEGAERIERVMRGVFAGNIFDLGAVDTSEMFKEGKMDFRHTLEKLKPRPWFVDGLDAFRDKLLSQSKYQCAVVFVDNAGPDVVLGMLPFVRELLRSEIGVILTANETPSLNDVTHDELTVLVNRVCEMDAIIAKAIESGELELITSGNGAPLIDLRQINPELAEAVYRREADLCVLEGMGRAIETNYDAEFACDCLKIAMLKDPDVAAGIGGSMFDLVLRFDQA